MNTQQYLSRIAYSGSLEPTPGVLRSLQRAHLLHIPFENLDISRGIPIELDVDKIYRKVFLKNRGGFCYELNGLFYELLASVGFREMCRYHQTSPDSHFTQKRLISLPTPEGRLTLSGDKLKIQEGDSVTETDLESEEAFRNKLWAYFRID